MYPPPENKTERKARSDCQGRYQERPQSSLHSASYGDRQCHRDSMRTNRGLLVDSDGSGTRPERQASDNEEFF
jgi:hypothetical protein